MSREVMTCLQQLGWQSVEKLKSLPRSAIIGQVDLFECVTAEQIDDLEGETTPLDFALSSGDDGVVYWRIRNPVACEPIPMNGKLNVWDLPEQSERAVRDALTRSATAPPDWTQAYSSSEPMRLMEFRATGPRHAS